MVKDYMASSTEHKDARRLLWNRRILPSLSLRTCT